MNPGGAFMCRSSTLTILANPGRLVDYYSLFWGPGVISTIDEPLGAFTHRFGVPKRFPFLSNPKVCLRVGRQDSQFWPILARFELLHSFGIPK